MAKDDDLIYQKALSLKLNVMITSAAHDSGTDRIYEVAKLLRWSSDHIVINVPGNEPMIDPELIRQVADFCSHRDEFDIVTAVNSISSTSDFVNPNIVKDIVGLENRALYFTRTLPHIIVTYLNLLI